MLLGKVKGSVISTRKMDKLVGYKLLLVEPYFGPKGDLIIAGDTIGSGIGELVLVTTGHSARYATDREAPIDAFIVGIVDGPPKMEK